MTEAYRRLLQRQLENAYAEFSALPDNQKTATYARQYHEDRIKPLARQLERPPGCPLNPMDCRAPEAECVCQGRGIQPPTMRPVRFIQFLRPNGRKEDITIERPEEIAALADRIWASGYTLETEVLSDEVTVNMTVSDEDDDLARVLVRNGPGVPTAVDSLIVTFAEAKEWT